MIDENKNPYISSWLLLITILVASMIVIGGLTRLTDSGLSITQWQLFSGFLPPLNNLEWDNYFNLYKKIPEYKLQNYSMSLEEFKVIFWWEWAHRFLGRIIGIFFLIPLLYFSYKNGFKSLKNFYFIFFLICVQGFLGWYMVSSGLVDRVDVSHYRLSLHLVLAFIIFIMLIWNYLKYTKINNFYNYNKEKIPFFLPNIFLLLLLIQISVGALVSGLDAGKIYTSWPLMNDSFFPDDSHINVFFSFYLFETPSLVQFFHRNLGYLIFLIFLFIIFNVYKNTQLYNFKKITLIVFVTLIIQIFLGILTILSAAEIILASLHQIGSIILVFFSTILVFKNSRTN